MRLNTSREHRRGRDDRPPLPYRSQEARDEQALGERPGRQPDMVEGVFFCCFVFFVGVFGFAVTPSPRTNAGMWGLAKSLERGGL